MDLKLGRPTLEGIRAMTRPLLFLLGLALLVTGCALQRERLTAPALERQRARETLTSADAIAVGVMGNPGKGYWEGDSIFTDYSFQVLRAENAPVGSTVTIKMHGGSVVDPSTGQITMLLVDHITPMPKEGDTAFLLLRKQGEKYVILDTMVLKDGAPIHARPANEIYLPVLSKLK